MTTFWLSFIDPQAWSDKRFLGVAICDMDESEGAVSIDRVLGTANFGASESCPGTKPGQLRLESFG